MTKKLLSVSAILLSVASSLTCTATQADPLFNGTITTADHGAIVSAEGGYAWLLGTPNEDMNGHSGSHSVGDITWGANLGYAWPIDSLSALGVELGYANNGQNKYTGGGGIADTGTLKITSEDIQLLGSFNTIWESGFNFFFKLGAALIRQKADLSGPVNINGTTVQAFNSTKYYPRPMAVIGVGYKLTPSINFYVEGSGIYGDYNTKWSSVGTSQSDINAASAVVAVKAGISYAFAE